MDYYYSYEYSYNPDVATGVGAEFLVFTYLISIAISILSIVSLWKLYKMAGHPGWASIIPFYNCYILNDIIFGSGITFLIYFIPFIGQIYLLYALFKFAKVYGKSDIFAIGMVFLSGIFIPLMAFSPSTYYNGPSTAMKSYGSSYGGYGSAGGYGNGYANRPMNTAGYDIYQGNQGYQNSGFQAQGNGFQSQNSGFQAQNNGFQSQGSGSFDPHNANSYVDNNVDQQNPYSGNDGGFNNF